jgi:hypothetical protein
MNLTHNSIRCTFNRVLCLIAFAFNLINFKRYLTALSSSVLIKKGSSYNGSKGRLVAGMKSSNGLQWAGT